MEYFVLLQKWSGLSWGTLGLIGYGLRFASTVILVYVPLRALLGIYRSHGYLYQLSDRTQLLDHWVEFLLPLVSLLPLPPYRRFLESRLKQAGWRPDWREEHFMALQLIYGFLAFLAAFLILSVLAGRSPLLPLTVAVAVIGLQNLQLHEKARSRLRHMNRDLPYFIDYLALAMSAGMGFNQAMESVVSQAGKGALADEFRLITKNLSLGMTRERALQQLKTRTGTPQMAQFVETLVQAIAQGAGVADTLQVIGSGLNTKRFQIAEEEAGKISVKMMIPVIIFVLPALMLMLLGPIILELTRV